MRSSLDAPIATSRGLSVPLASRTNTMLRSPVESTADRGTRERVLARAGRDAERGVHPRLEPELVVREHDANAHRARLGVEGGIDVAMRPVRDSPGSA